MSRCVWVALALAVLMPLGSAQTLASNATEVTNLCETQFCLADSPMACGGVCFLTAAAGDATMCTAACQASWYNPTVELCLSSQAVGTFVNEKIAATYAVCNAVAIAAAKLAAAKAKFEALFPCTATAPSATFDPTGLATCPTAASSTCPTTCSSALGLLPTSCLAQVNTTSATWAGVVKTCTASAITPVSASPAVVSGLSPGGFPGLGISPTSAPAAPSGAIQAAIATPLLVVALVSGLLHVLA